MPRLAKKRGIDAHFQISKVVGPTFAKLFWRHPWYDPNAHAKFRQAAIYRKKVITEFAGVQSTFLHF